MAKHGQVEPLSEDNKRQLAEVAKILRASLPDGVEYICLLVFPVPEHPEFMMTRMVSSIQNSDIVGSLLMDQGQHVLCAGDGIQGNPVREH